MDTWTIQERKNAETFFNLEKYLRAATQVEYFLSFIDLNGKWVDPPRQLTTTEKLSLSPKSGQCMGFLGEFKSAFRLLCNSFVPDKLHLSFLNSQNKYDICVAGSIWLEAIGNLPESMRITPPIVIASAQQVIELQEVNEGLSKIEPDGREAMILIAMLNEGIDGLANRKPQQFILDKAIGKNAASNDHRIPFAKLQELRFIVKGDNGRGFHLTNVGKLAAEELRRALVATK